MNDMLLQQAVQCGSLPTGILRLAINDESRIPPYAVPQRFKETRQRLRVYNLDVQLLSISGGQISEPTGNTLSLLQDFCRVGLSYFLVHWRAHSCHIKQLFAM